jgi:hypothetical protein
VVFPGSWNLISVIPRRAYLTPFPPRTTDAIVLVWLAGAGVLVRGTPLRPYGLPTVGSWVSSLRGDSKPLRSPLCGWGSIRNKRTLGSRTADALLLIFCRRSGFGSWNPARSVRGIPASGSPPRSPTTSNTSSLLCYPLRLLKTDETLLLLSAGCITGTVVDTETVTVRYQVH